MRPVPQIALDFIRRAEGEVLRVYDDARPGYVLKTGDKVEGTLTAGTGHTGGLSIGMTVTPELSSYWRTEDADKAAARIADLVKQEVVDGLTEHQYSALIAFVFNVGAGPTWTVWKLLNAGRIDQVPGQLMRFDQAKVNGVEKVIPGLINRRMAEVQLWNTPDAVAQPAVMPTATPGESTVSPAIDTVGAAVQIVQAAPIQPPPSSVTRIAATPPQPSAQKPLAQSKSFIAQIVTALGAFLLPLVNNLHDGAKSIFDALSPYKDGSNAIAQVEHYLTLALAITAVAAVILTIRKQRDMEHN